MWDFSLFDVVILLVLLYLLIYPIVSRICNCITEREQAKAFREFSKCMMEYYKNAGEEKEE